MGLSLFRRSLSLCLALSLSVSLSLSLSLLRRSAFSSMQTPSLLSCTLTMTSSPKPLPWSFVRHIIRLFVAIVHIHIRFLLSTITGKQVRILKSLTHPNVIDIYQFFKDDPKNYYVSIEYMKGGELFDRIVKRVGRGGGAGGSRGGCVFPLLLGKGRGAWVSRKGVFVSRPTMAHFHQRRGLRHHYPVLYLYARRLRLSVGWGRVEVEVARAPLGTSCRFPAFLLQNDVSCPRVLFFRVACVVTPHLLFTWNSTPGGTAYCSVATKPLSTSVQHSRFVGAPASVSASVPPLKFFFFTFIKCFLPGVLQREGGAKPLPHPAGRRAVLPRPRHRPPRPQAREPAADLAARRRQRQARRLRVRPEHHGRLRVDAVRHPRLRRAGDPPGGGLRHGGCCLACGVALCPCSWSLSFSCSCLFQFFVPVSLVSFVPFFPPACSCCFCLPLATIHCSASCVDDCALPTFT